MTVYVDDMRAPYGRMIMCHMIADSTEELLQMSDAIGLARRWLQKPGTVQEHFDVSLAYRKRAVDLGAQEITTRQLGLKLRERRSVKAAMERLGIPEPDPEVQHQRIIADELSHAHRNGR